MRKFITKLFSDESGATAIEYGLIAALIAVAIITAVSSVGTHLTSTFNSVANGALNPDTVCQRPREMAAAPESFSGRGGFPFSS